MNFLTPDTGLLIWQLFVFGLIALSLFVLFAVIRWSIRQIRR